MILQGESGRDLLEGDFDGDDLGLLMGKTNRQKRKARMRKFGRAFADIATGGAAEMFRKDSKVGRVMRDIATGGAAEMFQPGSKAGRVARAVATGGLSEVAHKVRSFKATGGQPTRVPLNLGPSVNAPRLTRSAPPIERLEPAENQGDQLEPAEDQGDQVDQIDQGDQGDQDEGDQDYDQGGSDQGDQE